MIFEIPPPKEKEKKKGKKLLKVSTFMFALHGSQMRYTWRVLEACVFSCFSNKSFKKLIYSSIDFVLTACTPYPELYKMTIEDLI